MEVIFLRHLLLLTSLINVCVSDKIGKLISKKYNSSCADEKYDSFSSNNCDFATDNAVEFALFRSCLYEKSNNGLLVERNLNSKLYNNYNIQWNLRLKKVYPLAYFLPNSANDVSDAVKCGIKSNIRLTPKSGGHSYEGISSGNNHSIVIDFRNMKHIEVDKDEANAWIEPGANIALVTAELWGNGGLGLPMGTCLTVGIGGLAIGGGIGYVSAMYGLTVDHIVEMEVVNGQGNIIKANANENDGLFWAIRGMGSGYVGIVTKFKFNLFQASRIKITHLIITYENSSFLEAWNAYQKFEQWVQLNNPKIFTSLSSLTSGDNATVPVVKKVINIVHIYDPIYQKMGNESLLQATDEIFSKANQISRNFTANYLRLVIGNGHVASLDNDDKMVDYLLQASKDLPPTRYFKAKSFLTKNFFSQSQMRRLEKLIAKQPLHATIIVERHRGVIQNVSTNNCAYSHRNIIFNIVVQYEGPPEYSKEGMDWLYNVWNELQFMDGKETYQNYMDLEIKDYYQRTYGINFKKLIQEKKKWDPENYFTNPRSIPINRD